MMPRREVALFKFCRIEVLSGPIEISIYGKQKLFNFLSVAMTGIAPCGREKVVVVEEEKV